MDVRFKIRPTSKHVTISLVDWRSVSTLTWPWQ